MSKNKYMVFFTYTVIVEATDYDEAEDNAHKVFSNHLSMGLGAKDFAISDAEDVTADYLYDLQLQEDLDKQSELY